jgi:arylsulfatase A-like enzyme
MVSTIVKYFANGLRAIVHLIFLIIRKHIRLYILPHLLPSRIKKYLLPSLDRPGVKAFLAACPAKTRDRDIDIDNYLDVSFKPSFNVIIIVVDALRNSQLSCEGYFRETTPIMDNNGLKFTAVSASSWTFPSVASILTGLYPHNHGAQLHGKMKNMFDFKTLRLIRDNVLTLPEILFFLEYDIYFAASMPFACWPLLGKVSPRLYFEKCRAEEMISDLVSWIRIERRDKFFAYIHLGDLHTPLNPPKEFRNFFGRVENLPNISTFDFVTSPKRKSNARKFQKYRRNRELLYDNTLRYVDSEIGRFYQAIKDQELHESTIIIVTSDHGEEFWEHAELEDRFFFRQDKTSGTSHGHSVFNELIRVPLIFIGPISGKPTTDLVSSVDIVPTITNLIGIRHYMTFDGKNIFSTGGTRTLLTEASGMGYEKKALTVDNYKLIYSKEDGIEWVFDLEKDPQELNTIIDPKITTPLVNKLQMILREDERLRIREAKKRIETQKLSRIKEI